MSASCVVKPSSFDPVLQSVSNQEAVQIVTRHNMHRKDPKVTRPSAKTAKQMQRMVSETSHETARLKPPIFSAKKRI